MYSKPLTNTLNLGKPKAFSLRKTIQGCQLSPHLFNVVLTECSRQSNQIRKRKKGQPNSKSKSHIFTVADDMILYITPNTPPKNNSN
jgi:hypothetical protein